MYSCDVYDTKHQQNGIGVFKIVKSDLKQPPNMLDGYSVDLVDAEKDRNTEHKSAINWSKLKMPLPKQNAYLVFNIARHRIAATLGLR